MSRASTIGIALALLASATAAARAQVTTQDGIGVQPLVRLDGISARRSAVQLGAGLGVPLGVYARMELTAGAGVAEGGLASGRADLTGRFLLDPFRESRYGLYAGGGLGMRYTQGHRNRAVLIALVGLEGRPVHRLAPFVELGYGGGARLGIGVRRALSRGR